MSKVTLKVLCNTDDAFLVWKADKLAGCFGFAIERVWLKTEVAARVLGKSEYLLNRVGFPGDAAAAPGQHQTSDVWPFQRYNWTDHEVQFGDSVKYRIVPMVGRQPGRLEPRNDWASEWVAVDAIQPDNGKMSCFFNRPLAASQWMARRAKADSIKTGAALVAAIANASDDGLRDFCGGSLIHELRRLFDHADGNPSVHLYAALFELKDAEIIRRFCKLGARAHLVLSNGSANSGEPDANQDGRAQVHAAGCVVIDRMTSKPRAVGDLGHNKFIVVADGENPVRVWTGSTNLTPTGLFTQVNNAISIDSPELAAQYLNQWQRLAAAGSEVPATLKKTNAAPGAGTADPADIKPWFTPTTRQADLAELRKLIDGSKDGILFLSFMPGPSGPVLDILEERASNKRFVRGVVNQFVGGAKGQLVAALVGGNSSDPMDLDVINPSGIKHQFAFWAEEFNRGGKISVLVHSKVLCIDPFGDKPVLVTGSHNFSSLASESNDENLLVIEGDAGLAQAYATHIISVYNHYRWRQYVAAEDAAGKSPWQKLEPAPDWQDGRLKSAKQQSEWEFWRV